MILMWANPLQGPLEGLGPDNGNFFGALKWDKRSEWHLGPKKSRFSGSIPSNGPCNGFAPIKGGGISGTKYIYFARYDSCTKKKLIRGHTISCGFTCNMKCAYSGEGEGGDTTTQCQTNWRITK